jgi:peroxiredoxin/tetratricopeptide (TPR) repeat protein
MFRPQRRQVHLLLTLGLMGLMGLMANGGVSWGEDQSQCTGKGTADPATSVGENQANTPLAGHSAHGAAYNEGPRQNAYLMEGTGDVSFPVTTASPEAQDFFNQGIGQLHGFWYYEAERSFRRVAALDPACAMAYWGLAMANRDNRQRAKEFIAEAVKRKDQATVREQLYINAMARYVESEKEKDKESDRDRRYVRDLEKIIRQFPCDVEAKALLAVHLWQSDRRGLAINSHQAFDSLLGDVFRVQPMHPAHHYRIHLWDQEEPEQALASAARCGQAAPRIAHMWHMPGHTYSRLKRYADAAWQQEASARADHAYMMRDRVLPDQIHNYAHNNEWLVRNLIHLGRVGDALALAKNMVELPRHPKYNAFQMKGTSSCKYGRERLFEVLETFDLWNELVELAETMYLEPTELAPEQIKRLRLLGVAHYHRGNSQGLAECIRQLEDWLDAADQSGEQVASRKSDETTKESEAAQDSESTAQPDRHLCENALAELRGLAQLARGETDEAAREFDRADDIPKLRLARLRFLCGDHQKAEELAGQLVKQGENEVAPLAMQVDLLRRMGKRDAAQIAFEKLRTVAASADLDSPRLARLGPFAKELGWAEDWRAALPAADDVGERPPLDSLGPFRWSPSPAENWSLPDAEGHLVSSSDFAGRPLVVIFYLGFGCVHCVEQLEAFAPLAERFGQVGIQLVAISTDNQQFLASSLAGIANNGSFPIPLLSDAPLRVFKAYRAYDDFEQMPLHATFLIDGAGMVRWQDISYEPFKDAQFLLTEAERLLSIDSR